MKPTTHTSGFVPPAPEELAKHFPQLEILELLGKGGMGAVYKARQPGLDRLVAVKILPPEIGADLAFAERFAREARALAKLSHQNIVSVFDFGQADGQYYFVMEFVDGMNLRQFIETGGLKPEVALAIVPQICEALQFAHNEGVVHRDIKPENILVDKQGRVKIADFGLAKLLGKARAEFTLTGAHQAMGTLHYMAPEQMRGAGSVDHRADIYSLGVVFYEMLTGQLPMGKFAPPSRKVHVDVRLDEVVLRALEQDPELRYQHASDVKTDMETISKAARAAAQAPPKTASDGVVFFRLSAFNLLFWLIWSALLAGLHWGYFSDARWYFQKELPYIYLSGAWFWLSLLFAFFSGYWWYLLAKSPETPRSFQDAWRTLQTPDRRALRLWGPGVAYLAIFILATALTMSFANDDVQSTTLIALFIAAPLVVAGSCWWAYREQVRALLRQRAASAENVDAMKTGTGSVSLPAAHERQALDACERLLTRERRERIRAGLAEGEHLLWADKIGIASTWRYAVRMGLTLMGILAGFFVGSGGLRELARTGWDIGSFANSWAGVLFVLAIGVAALLAIRRREHFFYTLTDRRAIVWDFGRWGSVSAQSYGPTQLASAECIENRNGSGSLIFEKASSYFSAARGFKDIDDVREVHELIRRVILNQPTTRVPL